MIHQHNTGTLPDIEFLQSVAEHTDSAVWFRAGSKWLRLQWLKIDSGEIIVCCDGGNKLSFPVDEATRDSFRVTMNRTVVWPVKHYGEKWEV